MVLVVCASVHSHDSHTHVCPKVPFIYMPHSQENSVERVSPSLLHLCCEKPISGFLLFIFFNMTYIASEFELSFHLNVYLNLKTITGQCIIL